MTPMIIAIGTKPLTIADVGAIAERKAIVALSADGRAAVSKSRAVVDRLVDQKILAYGITTGVGSQKDFSVDREAIARYNDLMITAHATLAPGRNAPPQVVRAALAIQLSLFARGRSESGSNWSKACWRDCRATTCQAHASACRSALPTSSP